MKSLLPPKSTFTLTKSMRLGGNQPTNPPWHENAVVTLYEFLVGSTSVRTCDLCVPPTHTHTNKKYNKQQQQPETNKSSSKQLQTTGVEISQTQQLVIIIFIR